MFVKLPGSFLGNEAVNAFMAAASFEEKINKKKSRIWKTERLPTYQYTPGSVRQEIREMGAKACPGVLKRESYFFGKECWFVTKDFFFTLKPLRPGEIYEEVEIQIKCYIFYGPRDGEWEIGVDPQPNESEYQLAKPAFDQLVSNLYAELSKN